MKDALERDPVVVLSHLARLSRTVADSWARSHGMTRAQWMILVWLEKQPGMSQTELAALVEVEPITVARLIDRLEKRGMVERRPDPADRRIWRLHLKDEAQPMLAEIYKAREALNAILVEGIPQKSVEAVINSLLQMKANINAVVARDRAKTA